MSAFVALLLAATCPGLARSQAQLPSASRVCVHNKGGFDLSFELWNTASNSLSSRSPSLASGKQACLDMWLMDIIRPGHPVVAVVKAETGMSHTLPPLLYRPISADVVAMGTVATASFSCMGAAEDFSCDLCMGAAEDFPSSPSCMGAAEDGKAVTWQPGALVGVPASQEARASKICVQNSGDFRMTARLWDTATGALGDWSPGFDMWSGGDSAVVCLDGGSLPGLARGHPLVLVANPEGANPSLVRSILYDPDATTPVLVECWGGRQSYSCAFRGAWQRRLQSAAATTPVLV